MKRLFFSLFLIITLTSTIGWSSVYIRYYNKDLKDYTFKCVIGGQTKTVEFGSDRSSSVVIPGQGSDVVISTPCGNVKIKSNSKIVIENGCIKLQYQTDERDQ